MFCFIRIRTLHFEIICNLKPSTIKKIEEEINKINRSIALNRESSEDEKELVGDFSLNYLR